MEKRDTFKKFIKYSYLINDTKSRLKTTIKMNAFKTISNVVGDVSASG